MPPKPKVVEGQTWRRPDGTRWVVLSVRNKVVDVQGDGAQMEVPILVLSETWELIPQS